MMRAIAENFFQHPWMKGAPAARRSEDLLPWPEKAPCNSGISAIHGGQIAKVAPKDGFTAPSRRLAAGKAHSCREFENEY
ncbi:hypothetical protein [Halomonas sp. M20]|uniref:hypothetical protein n=1 Tax=Halomonas sp. M20 TaxID=2763264 RepID=UPI001D09C8A5|nr:hypothetical protein [Halomonas sp. M20]